MKLLNGGKTNLLLELGGIHALPPAQITTNAAQVTADSTTWQLAKDAYFNLLTGTQNDCCIVESEAGMDYALFIASKVGLNYLVYDRGVFSEAGWDSDVADDVIEHYKDYLVENYRARRDAMYGYHVWDEPWINTSKTCINPDPPYNNLCNTYNHEGDVESWVSHFNTADPSKLAYVNLFPRYWCCFEDDAAYEDYLNRFLNNLDPLENPDLVSFDHYPFITAGTRTDYFYNLSIIRKMAGSRPFWAMPKSVHSGKLGVDPGVNPNENHLRFMAFCPIAYGAKGLVYFTYELPLPTERYFDAVFNDCSTQTEKYDIVKTINHWVTNVAAPVAMDGMNLGAYHKSNDPTGEAIPGQELLSPTTPLVHDIVDGPQVSAAENSNNVMVGIFREGTDTYYILVINKNLSTTTTTIRVLLKGDHRNNAHISPSVVGYVGGTTYYPLSTVYNSSTNKTRVDIGTLVGGEGRFIKLTNVSHPLGVTSRTDYDGDGSADLSVKTDGGVWKIDYSSNGFNEEWEEEFSGYGGASAQTVPADYDGDGLADLSVKDDPTGRWLIDYASDGFGAWDLSKNDHGGADHLAVRADFDGDGKADLSAKTDAGVWKIDYSSNGFKDGWDDTFAAYGGASAHPVPADYDGDHKADLSVKVDDGRWLIDYANNGFGSWDFQGESQSKYGASQALPVPADYDGDGKADLAVKIDSGSEEGVWKIDYAADGFHSQDWDWESGGIYGDANSQPAPSDFDGDGVADISVKTSQGWMIDYASDGFGVNLVYYDGYGEGDPLYVLAKI